eukprot:scaffold25571_cov61-Attheya_sp.AAC.1
MGPVHLGIGGGKRCSWTPPCLGSPFQSSRVDADADMMSTYSLSPSNLSGAANKKSSYRGSRGGHRAGAMMGYFFWRTGAETFPGPTCHIQPRSAEGRRACTFALERAVSRQDPRVVHFARSHKGPFRAWVRCTGPTCPTPLHRTNLHVF